MTIPVAVRNVTITTIKPSERTEHVKSIQPTFQDLLTSDLYFPILFAYRLRNIEDEYQNFISQLKSSLEKVLVAFFPYAGRWALNGGFGTVDGQGGWLLDCNDEGVPFIEAYVDRDIDDVVRASGGFKSVPELNGHEVLGMDSSVIKQKMRPEGMPPIFIQLTRFKCGGVVLVVSFCHIHCDGEAFFEFMTSWAEIARTGNCTVVPRVDRELATTFENFVSQLKEDEFPVLRDMVRMNSPFGKVIPSADMRSYEVNASTIEKLKESAKANSKTQFVSTNDCIVAALWKLLASLPASLTGEKPSAVMDMAEGRKRYCNPPMPHLVGNVFAPIMWTPPSSELVKESLHSIAENIRTNFNHTDWNSIFTLESLKGILAGLSCNDVNSWINSSWTKFSVYDVDFGVGGKPYFVPGPNGPFDFGMLGMSFVTPPAPAHSSSAATIYFYTSPKILDFMESLPEFWDFFLPWEQSSKMTAPEGS